MIDGELVGQVLRGKWRGVFMVMGTMDKGFSCVIILCPRQDMLFLCYYPLSSTGYVVCVSD